MKPIIFINSHPIQYFAPLYQFMNENGLNTKAWYCSDETMKGSLDKEFGVKIKWDIPLLEGYEHTFFRNYSIRPSLFNGFFGLVNFGLIANLFIIKKSFIIVHGWNYFTHFFVLLIANLVGHTVCLRCEMPQNQEVAKNRSKRFLKRLILKIFVFPNVDYFLYIGTQNKLFYKDYGVNENKLIFCPYAVDNNRFEKERAALMPKLPELRIKLNIPETAKVILFSGKYIDKKRPMDILNAFKRMHNEEFWLIMLGEGPLRQEMETFIVENNLKNIILTGFVNQSNISEYYAISNLYVVCSTIGETWGLTVNEAMNFGLPVIISDQTGCASDLVINQDNGYIFETGNVNQLVDKIKDVLIYKKLKCLTPPETIIRKYSYQTICQNLKTLKFI